MNLLQKLDFDHIGQHKAIEFSEKIIADLLTNGTLYGILIKAVRICQANSPPLGLLCFEQFAFVSRNCFRKNKTTG